MCFFGGCGPCFDGLLCAMASSQVTLARVVESGCVVVLKKVHVRDGGRSGLPDNITRDIKALQSIDHPNVVSLIDLFGKVKCCALAVLHSASCTSNATPLAGLCAELEPRSYSFPCTACTGKLHRPRSRVLCDRFGKPSTNDYSTSGGASGEGFPLTNPPWLTSSP